MTELKYDAKIRSGANTVFSRYKSNVLKVNIGLIMLVIRHGQPRQTPAKQ